MEFANPPTFVKIIGVLLLIPIFFVLGSIFYSKHPNTIVNQEFAYVYNGSNTNGSSNATGMNSLNTSYFQWQGSLPQVGVGGGGPTPSVTGVVNPTLTYCPFIKTTK